MAKAREKQLKTGVGREFLKNIINCGGAGLSTLPDRQAGDR